MRSRLLMFNLLVMLIVLVPTMAVAVSADDTLTPAQVVEMDPSQNGSIVVVEGEAVGDILHAQGGGSWVNLLGEEVGLGIWITAEMVERIEHLGHYKHSGDVVRVRGTLNRTCDVHAGEFDVHADELQIIAVGEPIVHVMRPNEGVIGVVGFVIGFVLWFRYRAVRARL